MNEFREALAGACHETADERDRDEARLAEILAEGLDWKYKPGDFTTLLRVIASFRAERDAAVAALAALREAAQEILPLIPHDFGGVAMERFEALASLDGA